MPSWRKLKRKMKARRVRAKKVTAKTAKQARIRRLGCVERQPLRRARRSLWKKRVRHLGFPKFSLPLFANLVYPAEIQLHTCESLLKKIVDECAALHKK